MNKAQEVAKRIAYHWENRILGSDAHKRIFHPLFTSLFAKQTPECTYIDMRIFVIRASGAQHAVLEGKKTKSREIATRKASKEDAHNFAFFLEETIYEDFYASLHRQRYFITFSESIPPGMDFIRFVIRLDVSRGG